MTANELADKLENNTVSWGDCTHEQHDNDKYIKEQASAMLRQQQAEIEALKKDLALKTRDRDVFANFTLSYEKRIAELEKLEVEIELLKPYKKKIEQMEQAYDNHYANEFRHLKKASKK